MRSIGVFRRCALLIFILVLTMIIPQTHASINDTYTGPNTMFTAYYYTPEVFSSQAENGKIIFYEQWTFAIRDEDTPTGKANLGDFELFAASYVAEGYTPEEGYFVKAIVFGTLEYVEDDGWEHWEPNADFKVSGGGSFTVRPVAGPDYTDWEKVVFKISATDYYGSKIAISGTYICASGPPAYYISLTIKLTGQVYKYNFDNDSWTPTGNVETHTLKLRGYPKYYYILEPYYVYTYAYPDQLTFFPEEWPYFWD